MTKGTISITIQNTPSMAKTIKIPRTLLLIWAVVSFLPLPGVDIARAQKATLEPVTIQLRWFHQFQFAGYYAAIEKGFYADEGLAVFLTEFDPRTGWVAPVLEGQAQYGVGDPGLLKLRTEGEPVVVLTQIFQHSPEILLTLRGSGILSPYEIVGKKVMVPAEDTGSAPIQAMVLETLGSLDRVMVIPHSYNYENLLKGKVDAITGYLSNEPFRLKQEGVEVNIIDPRSYGIDFYGDNLFTTEKEINEHPYRVDKMIRATLKGWAYALEHKDEIIGLIERKYNPNLDRRQLRYEAKVVDQMILPDLVTIGHINPKRYDRIAETYQRLGISATSSVPEGFIYNKVTKPAVALTPEELAWLEAHPGIQMGYTDTLEPEVIVNTDGTYSGMVVDFLNALNEELGTEIGLRVYSIPELLDKAKNKRIDGILNLHPEYADSLGLLKTQTYWPAYPAVFARKETSFKSPDDFADKRVAIIDEVYITQKLMDRHGKQATILKVDDALGGLQSVERGKADFFLGFSYNSFFIPKYQLFDVVPAYVFIDSPEWFGIGIRADWPELVSILNKGISVFSGEEIHAIIEKWSYLPQKPEAIELTPEERAWLAQSHTVRVRVTDQAPYMFSRDGKEVGIAADLLSVVSKRTGIKFHFVIPSPSFSADLEGLIQHTGPDLMGSLTPTPEREKNILFTKPYISSPKFIFTRDDAEFVASMENLTGKTVAVIKDYLVHRELAENYPDINLVFCKNNKDALKAVSTGKAFAFIGGLLSTPLMINEYGLRNLKAAAPSALLDATVAMAIRNDWPELRDIIEKVIDVTPENERSAILNKWSSVNIEYGIRPADVLKWVLGAVGGAFVIILLFVFWNRSLSKKVIDRTAELESSNKSLEAEVINRKQKERQLQGYQKRLKALASQLTLAEEKERRTIAADLHDHVGHSLALARMQLKGIGETKSELEKSILVKDVSNILLSALQDTRSLIFELSSPTMNEIGLGAAISELLEEQIEKRYGLKTELIDDISDAHRKILDDNVRALLFRNVRELLTNVVKHAQAHKVIVHIAEDAAAVIITVEDDGIGFDPNAESISKGRTGGFGLFSIQERMNDLGGSFDIQSEPGKGSRVELTVPLPVKQSIE